MPSPTQQIGFDAETIACQYLQQQGLILLATQFSCRMGEIDLIMREGDILVFVEVRYRDNARRYGGSLCSITKTKQQKLIRTASYYLQCHGSYHTQHCRFDVFAIDHDHHHKFQWIKDAFQAH